LAREISVTVGLAMRESEGLSEPSSLIPTRFQMSQHFDPVGTASKEKSSHIVITSMDIATPGSVVVTLNADMKKELLMTRSNSN
jgi:hypothetical protein